MSACSFCGTLAHYGHDRSCHLYRDEPEEHEDVRLEVARVPFSAELVADAARLSTPCAECGNPWPWHGTDCVALPTWSPRQRPVRTTIHWRKHRSWHQPQGAPTVITCRTNGELMARTQQFWHVGPKVLDVTYGRGKFWTHVQGVDVVGHDLRLDGVNFLALPEPSGSQDVVVFDPDYISTGGRDTTTVPDFVDRYGLRHSASTPAGLRGVNDAGMTECVRVLRKGGRLVMKCMDYVSSGTLQLEHVHYACTAERLGLRPRAMIVHHSGTGPQPKVNLDGTLRRQVHPRAAHSFLMIYEKR